jgi:transcriptional regulator with XRE-family HTH domain
MRRPWVTSPSYAAAISHLIDARKTAGLSQRQLADRLNKPRSFVSKLESRERRLDVVEFIAYTRALGLNPAAVAGALSDLLPGDLEF